MSRLGEGPLCPRVQVKSALHVSPYDSIYIPYRLGIFGGGSFPPHGTFTEYIVSRKGSSVPDTRAPRRSSHCGMASRRINCLEVSKAFHYTIHNILLAATPSRAVTVNAKVQHGQNIVITGIGGGVAIIAMQIWLAIGANVYVRVTSGDPDKIRRATLLGAKGGANYRDS